MSRKFSFRFHSDPPTRLCPHTNLLSFFNFVARFTSFNNGSKFFSEKRVHSWDRFKTCSFLPKLKIFCIKNVRVNFPHLLRRCIALKIQHEINEKSCKKWQFKSVISSERTKMIELSWLVVSSVSSFLRVIQRLLLDKTCWRLACRTILEKQLWITNAGKIE